MGTYFIVREMCNSLYHFWTVYQMQEGGGPTYGGVLLRAIVPGVERLLKQPFLEHFVARNN